MNVARIHRMALNILIYNELDVNNSVQLDYSLLINSEFNVINQWNNQYFDSNIHLPQDAPNYS